MPRFRVGEPLKREGEDKRPLVLTGPADKVSSRELRTRAVRTEHISPGAVRTTHLADEVFVLDSFVMVSPDGTEWTVTIDDLGDLGTSS
jgi:hypothetical protein